MTIRKRLAMTLLVLLGCCAAGPSEVSAHEFWLTSDDSATGAGVAIYAFVGEGLDGEPIRYSAPYTESLRIYPPAGGSLPCIDLTGTTSHGGWTFAQLPPGTGGVVTFVSRFVDHEMEGAAFEAYLEEDGLDAIRDRWDFGAREGVVRERFRRAAKLYLPGPGPGPASFAECGADMRSRRGGIEGKVRRDQGIEFGSSPRVDPCVPVGLPLEIIPTMDPLCARTNVEFLVYWNGRPLEGAFVRTWHDGRAVPAGSERTDADGAVEFDVSLPGEWLISVVHMTPSQDPESDWESTWASFTFRQR
ncbi:MAG: DUF4198 domain-containing protein [Candidatus Eisenbacteria bacterium]